MDSMRKASLSCACAAMVFARLYCTRWQHGYEAISLNRIINETLARNGELTESDLEQIYQTYLSPIRTTERIDKLGARVINEIDDVMALITDALGLTAGFGDSLKGAAEKLGAADSREQVKAVVEALMRSTREMQETNKALEDRLDGLEGRDQQSSA